MKMRPDFFLELPRNFAFLKNLPLSFRTEVLKAGTQTETGRWYLVKISGQEMNLKSAVPLQPGETLILQKTGDLQLKVIERLPGSEPHETERLSSHSVRNEPRDATQMQEQIFIPETFQDALLLYSLKVLNEKNNKVLVNENKSYYFDLIWPERLQGLFKQKKDSGYDLYLSQENLQEFSYHTEELISLFSDLPIHSVNIVPESALKNLRKTGINITS